MGEDRKQVTGGGGNSHHISFLVMEAEILGCLSAVSLPVPCKSPYRPWHFKNSQKPNENSLGLNHLIRTCSLVQFRRNRWELYTAQRDAQTLRTQQSWLTEQNVNQSSRERISQLRRHISSQKFSVSLIFRSQVWGYLKLIDSPRKRTVLWKQKYIQLNIWGATWFWDSPVFKPYCVNKWVLSLHHRTFCHCFVHDSSSVSICEWI